MYNDFSLKIYGAISMNHTVQEQSEIFSEITEQRNSFITHRKASEDPFLNGEASRDCAHAFALEGHLAKISTLLKLAKIKHSEMAKV
jgi:hypothetical protein